MPWVPPSPNMPNTSAALLYPGTCLVEGTNLSEGRGTTKPFEFVGAPWIDAFQLADELNQRALPGVAFAPFILRLLSRNIREKLVRASRCTRWIGRRSSRYASGSTSSTPSTGTIRPRLRGWGARGDSSISSQGPTDFVRKSNVVGPPTRSGTSGTKRVSRTVASGRAFCFTGKRHFYL